MESSSSHEQNKFLKFNPLNSRQQGDNEFQLPASTSQGDSILCKEMCICSHTQIRENVYVFFFIHEYKYEKTAEKDRIKPQKKNLVQLGLHGPLEVGHWHRTD